MEWPRHIRAGILTIRGSHVLAVAEYRRVLEQDPIDPPALIAVLQDCRRRSAVAEAIDVAERSLARDPSNFIALDGLAWAYLEKADHDLAKPVVERALQAFEAMNTGSAFKGVPSLMLGGARLLSRLPGLRGRFPAIPPTAELASDAARDLRAWKQWALDYLAWYGEHCSGKGGEHR